MQGEKAELRRDQAEGERVGIKIIIMIIIFIIIVIIRGKERKRMRTNLIVGVSSFEEVKQSRRAMCPGDILVHCCTLSLCHLGSEMDDHHIHPNINTEII